MPGEILLASGIGDISEKQTKCKGSQEKNLLGRASNWIISNSFIPCKPYMLELINSFQHLE